MTRAQVRGYSGWQVSAAPKMRYAPFHRGICGGLNFDTEAQQSQKRFTTLCGSEADCFWTCRGVPAETYLGQHILVPLAIGIMPNKVICSIRQLS